MSRPAEPTSHVVDDIFGRQADACRRYVDLLSSRGIEYGLIGPREVDRLWERHIYNSAAVAGLLPSGIRVVDVGSGAGLPGLPVALARPDVSMTLLEPLLRRADFLSAVVDELEMSDQVRVVRSRAEDHRERYDAVLARAVAPLERLVGWCLALLAPGGSMVFLKGARAEDEVRDAQALLRTWRLEAEVRTVRAHAETDTARVIRLTRA